MGDWFIGVLITLTFIAVIYGLYTGTMEIQVENLFMLPIGLIVGAALLALLSDSNKEG